MKSAPEFTLGIMGFAALLLCGTALRAQEPAEPEIDPGELLRQIQRNMEAVEKGLDELATEDAVAAGKRTVESINKAIEEMKNSGQQVTKDIDTIIKQMKSSGGGGGGGGGGQSSGKGGQQGRNSGKERGSAKDRNKPEPGSEKNGEGQKPEAKGGAEDNTGKNPQGGRNENGPTRPDDPRERFRQELLEGRWGVLPPELRQRLIERNFREFTPEYQEELRAYFRRLAR